MWTREIPTEPGYYWFYGDPFASKQSLFSGRRIELHVVKVHRIRNGSMFFVTEGNFMYPKDIWAGEWMACKPPALPNEMEER